MSVSGKHLYPSPVRNQPLKSMHQTALGSVAAANGRVLGTTMRWRRRRRTRVRPLRWMMSAMALTLGNWTPGSMLTR
jgi:hypothetical protein